MTTMNWGRFLIGVLVVTVIAFVTDGFLHEKLVNADWHEVYRNLGANEPTENAGSMVYFAIFELGRGILGMTLYVLLRDCLRPGPKTATLAGFVMWIAFSLTGPVQFIPLKFFSTSLWLKVGAFQLITSIVATIAGAALYKGPANSPARA